MAKAKKKKGAAAGTPAKSFTFRTDQASQAYVIVDSRGTGAAGDIHIQTAYPVLT